MDTPLIREIKIEDDTAIASVIRSVLLEMGAPKVGTAYEDKTLDTMTANYKKPRSVYFIIEEKDKVIGGAGIAPLENGDPSICELQKMYFLPEARSRGLGTQMMTICLNKARELDFKQCYLETLPYMKAATKLYNASGFKQLEASLGETGHYSCDVWMLKTL